MGKAITVLSSFAICLLFIGCVSINAVSISNVTPEIGQVVTAEASGFGFLNLTTPNIDDLEGEALYNLKSQGAVKNITVRLSRRDFFGIAQRYTVSIKGEQ